MGGGLIGGEFVGANEAGVGGADGGAGVIPEFGGFEAELLGEDDGFADGAEAAFVGGDDGDEI